MRIPLAPIAALLGLACSTSMPNGSRPVTANDRSGKVVARYVCQSPVMFTVANGKVVDPSEKSDPNSDIVVYDTASGPVLVEGQQATTNHWVDSGRDHFFSWYGSGLGAETILADDRQSATQLFWASQPDDKDAYVMRRFPDGTTRPAGIPVDVLSCLARPRFEDRRIKFGNPFILDGLTPVPVDSVGHPLTLKMKSCGRGEGKLMQTGSDRFHNDWAWVPFEVLLPANTQDVAFLSYERSLLGRQLVWLVGLQDDERGKDQKVFHTRFGNVELVGSVKADGHDPLSRYVVITGGIIGLSNSLENSSVSCVYER